MSKKSFPTQHANQFHLIPSPAISYAFSPALPKISYMRGWWWLKPRFSMNAKRWWNMNHIHLVHASWLTAHAFRTHAISYFKSQSFAQEFHSYLDTYTERKSLIYPRAEGDETLDLHLFKPNFRFHLDSISPGLVCIWYVYVS